MLEAQQAMQQAESLSTPGQNRSHNHCDMMMKTLSFARTLWAWTMDKGHKHKRFGVFSNTFGKTIYNIS